MTRDLSTIDTDTVAKLAEGNGEIQFWSTLITTVCQREAEIRRALDPAVIQKVLIRLARLTRSKPQNVGPLTMAEINQAFEDIAGFPAVEDSAVMLQRLSLLGRVGLESTERRFIDTYFLDGLRADDINREVYVGNDSIVNERWRNPLEPFGIRVIVNEIGLAADISGFVKMMRKAAVGPNHVLAGELIAAILASHDGTFDFNNLRVTDAHICYLDLSGSSASNLTIDNSVIDHLEVTDAHPKNLLIKNCLIRQVDGVTEEGGLPEWLSDNEIETFQSISTVTRIKTADLSEEQLVFVTIVKKTFFQPGSGRREEALLRGLGDRVERRKIGRILNLLVDEGMLKRFKGESGNVYAPVRKHTRRMNDILMKLTLSEDPLWTSLRK